MLILMFLFFPTSISKSSLLNDLSKLHSRVQHNDGNNVELSSNVNDSQLTTATHNNVLNDYTNKCSKNEMINVCGDILELLKSKTKCKKSNEVISNSDLYSTISSTSNLDLPQNIKITPDFSSHDLPSIFPDPDAPVVCGMNNHLISSITQLQSNVFGCLEKEYETKCDELKT